MKYQLNENPKGSLVPIIELKPREAGNINHVAIYPHKSVIFMSPVQGAKYYSTLSIPEIFCFDEFPYTEDSRKLAYFGDVALRHFAKKRNLPLNELQEIKELEKEYRDRVASASDSPSHA